MNISETPTFDIVAAIGLVLSGLSFLTMLGKRSQRVEDGINHLLAKVDELSRRVERLEGLYIK